MYGDSISKQKLSYYQQGLAKTNMENTTIEIIPTSEINLTKVQQIESELSEVGNRINNQIESLQKEREERLSMFSQLNRQSDILGQDSSYFRKVCEDINVFIPEIKEINVAVANTSDFKNTTRNLPLVVAKWPNSKAADREKLRQFIISKYNLDTLKLMAVSYTHLTLPTTPYV